MIFVNEEFDAEEGIVICGYYVPYGRWKNAPHFPQSVDSGMMMLGRKLAAHGRIDMTDYLIRTKEIEKLAAGENRNIKVHLDSIDVNPDMNVADEVVLVVDDVTTSGNSLYACRDILMEHGAKRVALLALGQTKI